MESHPPHLEKAHRQTDTHACRRTSTQSHSDVHTPTHKYARIHTHRREGKQTQTHMHTSTQAHKHTDTRTHLHTQVWLEGKEHGQAHALLQGRKLFQHYLDDSCEINEPESLCRSTCTSTEHCRPNPVPQLHGMALPGSKISLQLHPAAVSLPAPSSLFAPIQKVYLLVSMRHEICSHTWWNRGRITLWNRSRHYEMQTYRRVSRDRENTRPPLYRNFKHFYE